MIAAGCALVSPIEGLYFILFTTMGGGILAIIAAAMKGQASSNTCERVLDHAHRKDGPYTHRSGDDKRHAPLRNSNFLRRNRAYAHALFLVHFEGILT